MELIKIEQPAIITEQFADIGKEIDEKITLAKGMEISEENYKDAKKIRAEMNKEASGYAADFKQIEEVALKPWNTIKTAYKESIRDKYAEADRIYKEKIGENESAIKSRKEEKIISFFTEHKEADGLDFLKWSDMCITVKLSDSEKHLKDTVMAKIAQIKGGYDAISTMDDAAEILAEYKSNGFVLSGAISVVQNRKDAAERQAAEIERAREAKAAERDHIEALKAADPEIEKVVEVKNVSATFTVSAELEKIRALVEFMRGENIEFEQIK